MPTGSRCSTGCSTTASPSSPDWTGQDLPAAGIEAEIDRDQRGLRQRRRACAGDRSDRARPPPRLRPVPGVARCDTAIDARSMDDRARRPGRRRRVELEEPSCDARRSSRPRIRATTSGRSISSTSPKPTRSPSATVSCSGRVRATRAGVDYDRGHLDALEADLGDAIALLEETGDNLRRRRADHAGERVRPAGAVRSRPTRS